MNDIHAWCCPLPDVHSKAAAVIEARSALYFSRRARILVSRFNGVPHLTTDTRKTFFTTAIMTHTTHHRDWIQTHMIIHDNHDIHTSLHFCTSKLTLTSFLYLVHLTFIGHSLGFIFLLVSLLTAGHFYVSGFLLIDWLMVDRLRITDHYHKQTYNTHADTNK